MPHYLIGAGGHAKVIIEILELSNVAIGGLFDKLPDIDNIFGYSILNWEEYEQNKADKLIVSIGNNTIRKKVGQER